ncbi:heavy metal-binding domain-containing protein [Lutibacter sp. TH_r2]|uniref:heavy metal-binding domain-containing protein n=1 Tax=Lutibacter sp. TH_r2 TaxID=3082083 RepID=UPI002952D31C|nr:heavy metal-binding domain-containing protein [Lutibacter sp. TH_r2]MDV7187060.1 heavy metal-binding domain-containing protein [Lutibacter sp. TH_r2]
MKKSIILVATIFSMVIMFASCKETKKEAVKTECSEACATSSSCDENKVEATDKLAYQCPMDCDKGKTYDVAGTCPTCKMDLKQLKSKKDADCKPSECNDKKMSECTKCEPGKCECKKDVAANTSSCKSSEKSCDSKKSSCESSKLAKTVSECTKCEPGSCECKA